MRYNLTLIITLFVGITAYAQKNSAKNLPVKKVENRQLDALKTTSKKQIPVDTLINNKETATAVAEAILFNIYGKDNIVEQRPYNSQLIKGHWIISGNLPEEMVGGVFLIIINSL